MKIFRDKNLIDLREKLFSRSQEITKILNNSKPICIELIKCMELYWIYQADVSHWIEIASSIIYKVENNNFMRYNIVIPHVLSFNELEDIDSTLAERLDGSLNTFIKDVESDIVKSKKYPSLTSIKSFKYDDKYYKRMIRNLVCILSGEDINNVIIGGSKSGIYPQLNDLKLPTKVKKRYSFSDIKNILTEYIKYCNGGVDNGYLKYYNN